jgi:hypothetical protein
MVLDDVFSPTILICRVDTFFAKLAFDGSLGLGTDAFVRRKVFNSPHSRALRAQLVV